MRKEQEELTVLIDSPEDGAVEERGWVPVELAAAEDDAIKLLADDIPLEQGFAYEVTGRSYQRPDDHTGVSGDYFIFEEDGPETQDGRKGYAMDFLTWRACEPGTDGAVEFWDLELVEVEADQ